MRCQGGASRLTPVKFFRRMPVRLRRVTYCCIIEDKVEQNILTRHRLTTAPGWKCR